MHKILLNKSKKIFKNKEETAYMIPIIDDILQEITNFDKFVPLAVNLRVEGMYNRHWQALSEKRLIHRCLAQTVDYHFL